MPEVGPELAELNPIGILCGGLDKRPDDLAFASAKTQMSWRQLDEASRRLAAQYIGLGLEPGDRVASLMPNRPALVIHYLACIKAGLVVTPLNYRYRATEIDHPLEVSGASILLHHAERDEDGYLWFCGRKKQVIVHDGSYISAEEVEQAIAEHASIEMAGVIGIHDVVHGENVRAYVTLKEGAAPPTSTELIRFARDRVGYKAPEEIVILGKMPLNTTGKVDRVALVRMAQERLASSTTASKD
jgi:acyl-CoA synthetase (AMP-forming)/AMP-acid ligase II